MTHSGDQHCVCDAIYSFGHNECEASTSQICQLKSLESAPASFRYNDVDLDFDAAVDKAFEILSLARYPLITGLDSLGLGAQKLAVKIGMAAKAVIDTHIELSQHGSVMSLAREGSVTATLGEVVQRSDMILVVDCDPIVSHPRAFGSIIQLGNRPTIVALSSQQNATTELADKFIPVESGEIESSLMVLESIVRRTRLQPESHMPEIPMQHIRDLVQQICSCNYVCVLSSSNESDGSSACGSINDSLSSLVKSLNKFARVVALELRTDGNGLGAENVLTWSTGFPFAVDATGTVPRSFGREFCTTNVLRRREADAIMTIESISHSFEALDYDARQHLAQIPKIIFRHSYEEPDNAASEGNQSDADELMISNLSPLSDDFVRLDDLVFTVMATQSDVQIKQKKLSEFLGQLASRFTNHAR